MNKGGRLIAAIVMIVAMAMGLAGCRREAPPTPTAGSSGYKLDWPLMHGKELYQRNCQACHGEGGRGEGFNAPRLAAKPRNLSDATRLAGLPDGYLSGVIEQGGPSRGLSNIMPSFGATLQPDETRDLVVYLRSFYAPQTPAAAPGTAAPTTGTTAEP